MSNPKIKHHCKHCGGTNIQKLCVSKRYSYRGIQTNQTLFFTKPSYTYSQFTIQYHGRFRHVSTHRFDKFLVLGFSEKWLGVFEDPAVLATTGSSEKYADYVPSTLCLSCETLMIITSHPGAVVGVNHSTGNQVTIRD